MLRRDFLRQGAVSIATVLAGCSPRGPDSSLAGGGVPIVDAHCHVFNASDLPAARFLRQVVFEDYPRQAYHTFGIRDPDVRDIVYELLLRLLGADRAPSAMEEIEVLSGRRPARQGAQSIVAARNSAIRDTANFLIEVDKRRRGIVTMNVPQDGSPAASKEEKFLAFFLGSERMKILADQPLTQVQATAASRSAFLANNGLGRYLSWFSLFRLYRHVLVEKLVSDTKSQGFSPIMVTPALVDYDEWLFEDVRSPLGQQGDVMSMISQRFAKGADLPLVHGYMGFDPLREVAYRAGKPTASSLATVRKALVEQGFIGVKLYPPMGFRPSHNAGPYPKRTIDRLGFDPSGKLDEALRDLYRLCVLLDAPVLAHGYASNGAGPAYERRGDPAYWLPIFKEFPKLRACIAHFGRFDVKSVGRESDALPEGSWEWSLGEFIRELPRRNIYVDISYFSEVLSATSTERANLAQYFKTWVANFDPDVDHILFGSDWIMLGKENGYDRYVSSVNFFLRNDCGFSDDICDKVFRRNAMRYLPLERWSTGRGRLSNFYRKNGLDEARIPSVGPRAFADLFGR